MKKCAIIAGCYYINDKQFMHYAIPDFVEEINNNRNPIEFCDTNKLIALLDGLNTRLVDRQSLSLEAAVKKAVDEKLCDNLEKSDIGVVAGSISAALYPSSKFTLSAKEKGANFVNATEFTNTVGNAAASRVCIWNQFRNHVYSLSEGLNSGLDAVVNAFDNIKYGNMDAAFACATEEIGSAAILLQEENTIDCKNKHIIAYIKNCSSLYVGTDICDLKAYLKNLQKKFNINLKDADIYLSGNFDAANKLLMQENIKSKIDKKMWSLTPMINLGVCLYNYQKGCERDSLIFSTDSAGFISCVHVAR